jgi:hypothetical protein
MQLNMPHPPSSLQVLMQLLKESPSHVRKEAAYAIANICAGGGGGSGDLEALNWLFAADRDALAAMVSLMRSADMDAAKLGLQVGVPAGGLGAVAGEVSGRDFPVCDSIWCPGGGPGVAPALCGHGCCQARAAGGDSGLRLLLECSPPR